MISPRIKFFGISTLVDVLLFITPKEVMHAFTHHHDTAHHHDSEGGLQISSPHHHCELLKLDQQFNANDVCLMPPVRKLIVPVYPELLVHTPHSFRPQNNHTGTSLRGPPSAGFCVTFS